MDAVRVVLIDPIDESREALRRLMSGLESLWLTEICTSYAAATKAVADQAPQLAFLNLDSEPERALALMIELGQSSPQTILVPTSAQRAGDLILRAIRAGAREFLTLPADREELLAAIGRLVGSNAPGAASRMGGRIIAIAGAAGGVGTTTVAVNLAACLAKDESRSVVLADFDLLIGAADACLDIVTDYTLQEVALNADKLDLSLLKRSMARHESGVYVLPRPASMEEALKIEPETFRRVISLLRAAFGVVVIDTSKALQGSDVVAWEMAEQVLLVVQLELTCLRNTSRLLQAVREVDGLIEKTRLVVNRGGFRDCQITPRKAEESLNLPVAWTLPDAFHEAAVARTRGVPIGEAFPKSKLQKGYEDLASGLTSAWEQTAEVPRRRKRFAAMF